VFAFFQAGRGKKDRFEVTVYLNWIAVETLRKALSTLLEAQVKTVSSEGCHIFKKLIFTERVAEIRFAKKLDTLCGQVS